MIGTGTQDFDNRHSEMDLTRPRRAGTKEILVVHNTVGSDDAPGTDDALGTGTGTGVGTVVGTDILSQCNCCIQSSRDCHQTNYTGKSCCSLRARSFAYYWTFSVFSSFLGE